MSSRTNGRDRRSGPRQWPLDGARSRWRPWAGVLAVAFAGACGHRAPSAAAPAIVEHGPSVATSSSGVVTTSIPSHALSDAGVERPPTDATAADANITTVADGPAGPATAAAATAGPAAAAAKDGPRAPTASSAICLDFSPPRQVGEVKVRKLYELSGLAASRAHPGVLYAHGDSGSKARVFALDTTGVVRADFRLAGVQRTDWEDIAVGPGPGGGIFVFVGDIGDNGARKGDRPLRDEIQVFRFAEPPLPAAGGEIKQTVSDVIALRFKYPDRPHDAETLMVDPVTGDIVIVTKDGDGLSTVFRAPGTAAPNTVTVLERVTTLRIGLAGTKAARATAGDFSPTGDRIIVRTYGSVLLWPRATGQSLRAALGAPPRHLAVPPQPKGEAIAFGADGKSWFAGGEEDPALWRSDAICP